MKKKPSEKKQQAVYANLSRVILQFLKGKHFTPMEQTALFKQLSISKELVPTCKKIITELLTEGLIEIKQRKIHLKEEKANILIGTLRLHHRGFGFVIPDHKTEHPDDIFIPKHLTDNAVDGDRVEVCVSPNVSEKGPEGKILSVLERGRSHLAGIIYEISGDGSYLVHSPLLGASKRVIAKPGTLPPLQKGDRIIMKAISWGDQTAPTIGEVSHCLGNILDPACDIPSAIEEFELRGLFPQSVVAEASQFGTETKKSDLKGRLNLTKTTTVTIDPETARDFDDALSISKDRKGHYHLNVHIADVAHYVKPGSALDAEAVQRCNSTYFPGACVPMLPEELSNNLCSLKPDVIRLTQSVLMEFDKSGSLVNYSIERTYIKSCKRFSYEEAFEVLQEKKKSPLLKHLQLMVELCGLLKKKRNDRGSIDFALPELMVVVDAQGKPTGTKWIEYDITHQMVEEFMLKANEIVSTHLDRLGKPQLFRVHEEPAEENMRDFLQLARSFGFMVPETPTKQDLQKLFEEAKKSPYATQLCVGFIRSMKLAIYSPENVGHYGLSLEHYCHFTSPIRRYSDLIIQRQLFEEEVPLSSLEEIALRCSDQERVSFRAEMSVKTLKKLRLIKGQIDEDPSRHYKALITKIKPFGVYFELKELFLEGFLHISELEDDYFIYQQTAGQLFGKFSGKKHYVGEEITVSVVNLNLITQEMQWELAVRNKRKKKSRKAER
jgi:ribonuclease R